MLLSDVSSLRRASESSRDSKCESNCCFFCSYNSMNDLSHWLYREPRVRELVLVLFRLLGAELGLVRDIKELPI
jgi:hypothetical protein